MEVVERMKIMILEMMSCKSLYHEFTGDKMMLASWMNVEMLGHCNLTGSKTRDF